MLDNIRILTTMLGYCKWICLQPPPDTELQPSKIWSSILFIAMTRCNWHDILFVVSSCIDRQSSVSCDIFCWCVWENLSFPLPPELKAGAESWRQEQKANITPVSHCASIVLSLLLSVQGAPTSRRHTLPFLPPSQWWLNIGYPLTAPCLFFAF